MEAQLVSTAATTTRYNLDASHSSATFSVRHMMITNVRGEFQKIDGFFEYDAKNPQNSKLSGSVEVASINTREEKRDAHLRSADFFDAEKFPTINFVSKSVRKNGDKLEATGEITIHGVTRDITLTVTDITPEHVDPWGNRRIGASATGKLKRSDFGMTWNAALEAGGVLVGDEVTIHVEASLIKQG